MISSIGFALPVILIVPSTITLIIVATVFRNEDPGVFNSFLPSYVFFNSPSVYSFTDVFISDVTVSRFSVDSLVPTINPRYSAGRPSLALLALLSDISSVHNFPRMDAEV